MQTAGAGPGENKFYCHNPLIQRWVTSRLGRRRGSRRETSFLAGKFEASRNNVATGAGKLTSFFWFISLLSLFSITKVQNFKGFWLGKNC